MSDLNWVPGQQDVCIEAIKDVRRDDTDTDWMFITYAGKKGPDAQKVTFGAKGSGGVEEMKNHFHDDDIAFGLLRVSDRIDNSLTIKFVFINWLGNKVSIMQKARLSVHMGPIKEFFGQVHIDHNCNTYDELTHSLIMEKVMGYSGSGSKVLDDSGRTGLKSQVHGASTGGSQVKSGGRQAAEAVSFGDDVKNAIKEVRKDGSPKTWVLLGYHDNSSQLKVLADGEGDVSELAEHLTPALVAYGLIRKIEIIDNTEAVKFCYLRWVGPEVPIMTKAKIGTHAGDVYTNLFAPVHTSLDSPDIHEVNDDNIMRLIRNASGTAVHILDTPHQHQPAPSRPQQQQQPRPTEPRVQRPPAERKPVQQQKSQQDSAINFEDEDGIRAAIKSVRLDNNDINWALVTYTAAQSKTLKLEGTGNGGLAEMKDHMRDDAVMYGLYRTEEIIDASVTIKFAFIDWRGPNIHRMQRAVLGTHSGAVQSLFAPYHVDVMATSQDEITEEIVQKKIKNAAGTAHHVLD